MQYLKHGNMRDLPGICGSLWRESCRLVPRRGKWMAGVKENTFAETRGACILRLTALTRLTRIKACENRCLQDPEIQYIIFLFNQKVKLYMYHVLSTLGYEFSDFPNLSTFVNA